LEIREELNMENYNLYVNWEEYGKMIRTLIEKIKEEEVEYDGVYGVPSGGLPIATMVHQKLKIPLLMYPTKDTLIVDDISDTGLTIYFLPHKKIATLFSTPWTASKPDYYVDMKLNKDEWIVFPYE